MTSDMSHTGKNQEDNHTQGLWALTGGEAPTCPRLEGPVDADVAIVGAGYTGLSAALHLAEAGKSVCVLDAHEPGHGCSGRNGGQVNPGLKINPEEIVDHYGGEIGKRVMNITLDSPDLVFELISKHEIHCEAVRPGYVQGAHGSAADEVLQERARQWEAAGREVEYRDAAASRELLGTGTYSSTVRFASGGNVQPLSFARGLARAALKAGARIAGNSRVLEVQPSGSDWTLETAHGHVTARHVLFGTNGYTDNAWPGLKAAVVPVASLVAATEPLSDNIRKSILPGRHAVSETRPLMVYYKLDGHGRFVIGGRGPVWSDLEKANDQELRERAVDYFPMLRDVTWTHRWGGHVAMTMDHLPKLMQLAPNVLAGMGYNGRGLAMATVMGRQMALHVLGENTDLPVARSYRTPFHAFRNAGVFMSITKARVADWWITRQGRTS